MGYSRNRLDQTHSGLAGTHSCLTVQARTFTTSKRRPSHLLTFLFAIMAARPKLVQSMNSMTRREKFWSGSASMFQNLQRQKKRAVFPEETKAVLARKPFPLSAMSPTGTQVGSGMGVKHCGLLSLSEVESRDSLRFRRRCKFSRMSAHQRRHRSSLLGMEIVDGTGFPGCFGSLDPFGFLDVSGYGSFVIWELDFDPGFGEWLIQRYKGVA